MHVYNTMSNLEQSPEAEDIEISEEERSSLESYFNEYLSVVVCKPETAHSRTLCEHAIRVCQRARSPLSDQMQLLTDINQIVLLTHQPLYAQLMAIRALRIRVNVNNSREDKIAYTDIVTNLQTRMHQRPGWEEQEGPLTTNQIHNIRVQQLLLNAALYNAQGMKTPVYRENDNTYVNSKRMRVAAEVLEKHRLALNVPSREMSSKRGIDHIAQSSGIPEMTVLCPPGHYTSWEKMEEACSHGLPKKQGAFIPRLPSALSCVETTGFVQTESIPGVERRRDVHYFRLPPLPYRSEPAVPADRLVSEEELLEGAAVNNMSYYIAIQALRATEEKRREYDQGYEPTSNLRSRYIRQGVRGLVEHYVEQMVNHTIAPAQHISSQRRIEAGYDVEADTILQLANAEYNYETGDVWEDYNALRYTLRNAAVSMVLEYDEEQRQERLRTLEEVDRITIRTVLHHSSLSPLIELSKTFMNHGDRRHLNDEEQAYLDSMMAAVQEITANDNPDQISEEQAIAYELILRNYLEHAMRVRFETIRDLPIDQIDLHDDLPDK